MADYLEIKSGELRDTAKEVNRLNGELSERINDIRLKLKSLQDSWKSDSSNAIVDQYNSLAPKFDQYKKTVDSYADFLNKTADQYDTMEEALEKNARTVEFK